MIGYLKNQKKWVFKTKEKALFSSTKEHVPNEIRDLVNDKKGIDVEDSKQQAHNFATKQRKRHLQRVTKSHLDIRKNAHHVLSSIYEDLEWNTPEKFEKERKERKKLHDMHRKEYILKKQEKVLNFKNQKRNQYKRAEYNVNSQHYLTSMVSVHQQKKTLGKLLTLKERKPMDDMVPELVHIEEDMLERRNAGRMKRFKNRETSLRTRRIKQEVEDQKFHDRIRKLKRAYLIKHIKDAKKNGSTNPLMLKYIKPATPKLKQHRKITPRQARDDAIHHNQMSFKETYDYYLSKNYVDKPTPSVRPMASINSPPSSLITQKFHEDSLPKLRSSEEDDDDTTSVAMSTKSNNAFQQAQRAYYIENHQHKNMPKQPFRISGPVKKIVRTPPPRKKATYNFRNMDWDPSWELSGSQKPYAIYKLENEFEDKMNPQRRRKLHFWKLHVTDKDLYTDLLYNDNTMNTTIQDGFHPLNKTT